jgi:type IV secretion system protein VirD4
VNRKIKILIAGLLLLSLVTYGTGIASQLIYALFNWLGGNAGIGQGLAGILTGAITEYEPAYTEPLNIGRPHAVFAALLNTPYNLYGFVVVAILSGLIVIFLMKNNSVQGTMDNERNLVYSNKGTYGTAGWMTDDELRKELEVTKDLKRCRGTILGELDGKAVCVPENTMMNRNVAVYGAAGSMKSRAYVRNMVFQCVRRGESLIITDPKSELYASMAEYLRAARYVVKVFNLISPENSDSWNCLREIEGNNQEFMAQIFCDVVIRNTLLNGKMDPFWDTGAISLLKALCLYVVQVYPKYDRNIGEVYKLLANVASGGDGGGLKAAFAALPFGHSAKVPYEIFSQASENVQSGIIIGLANRIQVFQIEVLRTITAQSDGIDLTLPGKRKSAYFCITSDQDSTFDFLSSLFLSFLFIKLVRFADSQPSQSLLVPVHLLADELANIGVIPDLTKKISTVRSRKISMSVIFQNIAQMKNRYPDDGWLEIIGNCDCQLFLGCTDEMTAKFISDRTGEATIGVESTAKEMHSVRLSNYVPSQREVTSIGKRKLLTPDEVLRLPRDDALVIFRGQKVLKVKKFDYTKHPESKKLRDCNARDYIPNWREEWESPIFLTDDCEDERRQAIPTIKAARRKPTEVPRTQPSNPSQESVPEVATTSQSKLTPISPPQDETIQSVAQSGEVIEPTPSDITPTASAKRPRGRPRKKTGVDKWSHLQLALNEDEPFELIGISDVLSDL